MKTQAPASTTNSQPVHKIPHGSVSARIWRQDTDKVLSRNEHATPPELDFRTASSFAFCTKGFEHGNAGMLASVATGSSVSCRAGLCSPNGVLCLSRRTSPRLLLRGAQCVRPPAHFLATLHRSSCALEVHLLGSRFQAVSK